MNVLHQNTSKFTKFWMIPRLMTFFISLLAPTQASVFVNTFYFCQKFGNNVFMQGRRQNLKEWVLSF